MVLYTRNDKQQRRISSELMVLQKLSIKTATIHSETEYLGEIHHDSVMMSN